MDHVCNDLTGSPQTHSMGTPQVANSSGQLVLATNVYEAKIAFIGVDSIETAVTMKQYAQAHPQASTSEPSPVCGSTWPVGKQKLMSMKQFNIPFNVFLSAYVGKPTQEKWHFHRTEVWCIEAQARRSNCCTVFPSIEDHKEAPGVTKRRPKTCPTNQVHKSVGCFLRPLPFVMSPWTRFPEEGPSCCVVLPQIRQWCFQAL